MKFSSVLLVFCALFLLACSTTSEKKSNVKASNEENTVAETTNTTAPSALLPQGPATPNPYLHINPKVSEQVSVKFQNAIAAMQQKNWLSAETILQDLASSNSNLSGVHLNLGLVYRAKGDLVKAESAFNRAISANDKNVEAYNQLAVLNREQGKFADAEKLYKKALLIWPFYPEGHKNIAILYELYMGNSEQALLHYQAYQQLLPAPDKQVDSWVADLQRRLNGGKNTQKAEAK